MPHQVVQEYASNMAQTLLARSRGSRDGIDGASDDDAVMSTFVGDRLLCILPATLPGTSLVERLSLPSPVPAGRKGFSAVHIFWCLGQATSLHNTTYRLVSWHVWQSCSCLHQRLSLGSAMSSSPPLSQSTHATVHSPQLSRAHQSVGKHYQAETYIVLVTALRLSTHHAFA